jgi:hypothetical protein
MQDRIKIAAEVLPEKACFPVAISYGVSPRKTDRCAHPAVAQRLLGG